MSVAKAREVLLRHSMQKYYPTWENQSAPDSHASKQRAYNDVESYEGIDFTIGSNWIFSPSGLQKFFDLYSQEFQVMSYNCCPFHCSVPITVLYIGVNTDTYFYRTTVSRTMIPMLVFESIAIAMINPKSCPGSAKSWTR